MSAPARAFLIACGGTGGHLAPGIALAEGLVARGHRVTLLISHKKVDARLVEKYPHFTFLRIPGAPFALHPLRLLKFLASQLRGLAFGLALVRRTRPAAIVGFGGFTTAGIIVAGAFARVPIALHEANHAPGRAIRKLSAWARRVYLPPGVTLAGASAKTFRKIVNLGMPVRREIQREPAAAARLQLGLAPDRPVLAILGGSQGASALNDWARAHTAALAAEGVQLYCVTGLGKEPGTNAAAGTTNANAASASSAASQDAHFVPFCDRMGTLLSAADLVVSRAGAGTLAELARCGTPAVLVPFPHAADNHQQANARYFAARGGGVVVPQEKIADELMPLVRALLGDATRLENFRAALRRLDAADSLAVMLDDLETLVAGSAGRRPAKIDSSSRPAAGAPRESHS
jgi:UDP-N-acetylglucosamine--N-acetylmuramyl-(pentapeptide) pyrophosphoryl-undecaprenol N-acetylglucosamine transferase